MRHNLRTWTVFAALAMLAGRPTLSAQETPVPAGSLDQPSGLALFNEDSEHRLSITGFGVGQYDYDFNSDRNSFSDSALAVAFSKVLSDHLSVFAQLTASRDPLSPFVGAPSTSDIDTDIDNLQLSWTPSAASGLEVTFGKFDSPLAIERDDAPLNFQATSSWTFQFARPVKFAGIQIHEAFSPQFEGWAILANGWDVDSDNNKAKTFALYGMWNPSLDAHVGLGVIQGAEKDDRTGDARTAAVGTLLLQPAPTWVWGGEAVFGREPHSAEDGGTAEWYAAMLFVHHRFAEHWGLTLRGDYLDDRDGSRTGTPQVLTSLTLSPQYLVGGGFYGIFHYLDRTSMRLPELSVRLDLRYDHSTEAVFQTLTPDVGRRDHFASTLQTVFLF